MLLILTNAHKDHLGKSLVLNTDLIASIHRTGRTTDDVVEEVTYIFMPPHGTWEVSETPEEIINLIHLMNQAK